MVWIVLGAVALIVVIVASLGKGAVGLAAHRQVSFSQEYIAYMRSSAWRRRRTQCFRFTFGRDCLFPWLEATDADHLHYRNLGHELPWFDLVPLNRETHATVTIAREIFGRAPVNFILRIAYALWFSPYLAAVAGIAFLLWPGMYATLGAHLHALLGDVAAHM